MASKKLETALALESLRGPLEPHPINNQEKFLNELRTRFRTIFVEYNGNKSALMVPSMFVNDFGDQISRVALFVDSHNNQFEVLVEKVNDNIYFTRGWASLRDMYDIRLGAWLVLVYTGFGHFALTVYDRLLDEIIPPTFMPPMKLIIHKSDVPPDFVDDIPDSIDLLGYEHEPEFFHIEYEKTLTYYDVTSGFLVLPHQGFGQLAFNQASTSIKLVDDCGNSWDCMLIYVSFPWKHFKVGREWSRLVAGRRIGVGTKIIVGVETIGHNDTLYVTITHED